LAGAIGWQVLCTALDFRMEFTVDGLAFGVNELECVRAVAIHVTVTIRCATVAKQEHHLQSAK
jgi:hypothetical protein